LLAGPVLALLLFPGCACRQPKNARVDASLAPLIPSQTQLLAGLRLDKLKGSEFYRTWVEGRRIPQLEEFAKRSGLDPRKDLWELVLAYNGEQSLVLARGKFGGFQGLQPDIRIEGMQRFTYKSYTLLGTPEAVVTFFNTTVAVAGPKAAVERVIDNRDKSGEEAPRRLLAMVEALPPETHAWVVTANGGALLPELPTRGNFANLGRAAANMQQLTIAATLADAFRLNLAATYTDDASARQVEGALRGFIGMGRLSTPTDKPELLQFYDGIRTKAAGPKLEVAVQAPLELIETAARQVLPTRRPAE
jgi:hypothetical protein